MRRLTRDPGRIPRSIQFIVALAFATLIAVVIGLMTLSFVAQRRNEREAAREGTRVNEVVGEERRTAMDELAKLSRSAGSASVAADLANLDRVLLLNVAEPGSVASLPGSPAAHPELDRPIIEWARALASGSAKSAAGMVSAGDLYDVAALPFPAPIAGRPGSGPRPVIVGLRRVDAAYLERLSQKAQVRGLRLVRAIGDAPPDEGLALGDDWGGYSLIWEPKRPGDQFMLDWTVLSVAVTSALAIVIVLRARREAAKLHARETRAIEASRNDWLSGLPNRVHFNLTLDNNLKALRSEGGKLALFHLDIDRFREVNETYGTQTGDALIQAVTRRIHAAVGKAHLAARFEGDRFSILQPGIADAGDCQHLAARLQQQMKDPFEAGGDALFLSLSMGVAIAPDDAAERTQLVTLAELALYRAKREGRNRLALYRPALQDEWRRRSAVERELRHAITQEGLVLNYQPIVDCHTGRVVCAEALVRWNHPTEGLITPDRFIGLAEDRDLIAPLGDWALRAACTAARQWPAISMAVNVSPLHFRRPDFVDTVCRLIDETGLEPGRLELELTEGVLVDHEAETIAAMAALRRKGLRLAIDDFGTGYSSLVYLRRFAVDKIKIDRAFIETLEPEGESGILLESVVRLGRALGLTVTAEGIEVPAQRDFLRGVGCHQLQGFLIARPMPEAEFTAFLRASQGTEEQDLPRAVA